MCIFIVGISLSTGAVAATLSGYMIPLARWLFTRLLPRYQRPGATIVAPDQICRTAWEEIMAEFEGVVPAIVTPMTPEGELNEAAFRELLEFDIQAGVHGFWIAGGTGEGIMLSDEENNRIAEISTDQIRGRAKAIMHVGAPTTARAARMAEYAARAGADAICCVPPFFYRFSDEAIVEHYRVVAEAADLPLFVYNLPRATGVEITPDLMKKIQERVPQLTGLKHSALDFANIRAFADMDLSCFTGSAKLMLPALTIGAAGIVDGPPCAAPEPWLEIWNAYRDGDMERAGVAQARASELLGLVLGHGMPLYFASVKALAGERIGIDCGDPRPPFSSLDPDQRADLLEVAARLGVTRVSVGQPGD
jgi:dihydrodipicolinate synthase/N-acetylneuraminate lyase